MSKRELLIVVLLIVAASTVAGSILYIKTANANSHLALAEFNVDKLTCGSCVETITSVLAKVDGVDTVKVNVTTGRSEVSYQPEQVSAKAIAAAISASGYPAEVTANLTPEQYRARKEETSSMAELYVARIGGRLLSHEEFNSIIENQMLLAGVANQPEFRDQVVAQAWPAIQQRILLLEAATENNVVVQDGEVELRIKEIRQHQDNFDDAISARYGSLDNFQRQIKEQMIIQRNINDHVLAGIDDPAKRRVRFENWFRDLSANAKVVIFDPSLEQLTSRGGGSCGSGSGSCCG